jgi:hypothetical protein
VTQQVKNVMSALVIGLMGFVASSGLADDQSAFLQLLADQALRQQILLAAGRSTVMLQNPCPSAQYTIDNKPFVHTAPVFDSSGHIVAGDWKQIEDTEFVSQESTAVQGGKGLPWRELWTLVTCVQKMQVPMLFVPDATGTSISAGPNKAVKVIPLVPGAN